MSKYNKNLIRVEKPGEKCRYIGQHLFLYGTYYLMGGRTEIKVVGHIGYKYPDCKIISASCSSKYFNHIGKVVNISRQILYPRRGKA